MTEFELIARFFTRPSTRAALGNGDDCALVAPSPGNVFAVTTDTLIEGRHFLPTIDPARLGRRAVHVNLSDLAAMGAAPRFALLSLTLPEINEPWIAAFAQGLWSALDAFDVELVGGNTTRGPLAIAITALGDVPPGAALRRSGATAGDELWVSGPLGDAGWALYSLLPDAAVPGGRRPVATQAQIDRYECPTARVALGQALRGLASSCIDISDGLLSEARHIATASGVSIDIEMAAIPTSIADCNRQPDAALAQRCVLATGDAYELLFTAPAWRREDVTHCLVAHGLQGACIGRVVAADARPTVRVLDAKSQAMSIAINGWDHFA